MTVINYVNQVTYGKYMKLSWNIFLFHLSLWHEYMTNKLHHRVDGCRGLRRHQGHTLSLLGDVEIPLIKPMKYPLIFLLINDRFCVARAAFALFSLPPRRHALTMTRRLTLHMSSISSWESSAEESFRGEWWANEYKFRTKHKLRQIVFALTYNTGYIVKYPPSMKWNKTAFRSNVQWGGGGQVTRSLWLELLQAMNVKQQKEIGVWNIERGL